MMVTYLTRSLLALSLVGCVTQEGELEDFDQLEELDQEVKNGAVRLPETFGAARLTGKLNGNPHTCTLALIENDLALTSTLCAGLTATSVTVAGVTTSVAVTRLPWQGPSGLVAVQLRKPLPVVTGNGLETTGFVRDVSRTPLVAKQKVHCFGFFQASFQQAQFEVVDIDAAGNYSLLGGLGGNGQAVQLTTQGDDGAFCMNDGGTELVAIVNDPVNRRAAPVHTFGVALDDIRFVAERARQGVALSLINASTTNPVNGAQAIQGGHTPSSAAPVLPRRGNPASQAFYYWNVPSGSPDVYMLVNASNGLCLSKTGHGMTSQRCDRNQQTSAQRFWLQIDGTQYRIRDHASTLAAQMSGSTLQFKAYSQTPEQKWEQWLNWF